MNVPASTPIPIPTFQQETGDGPSPGDLLEFLQDFLAGLDSNAPSLSQEHREASWHHLVSGLTENFLGSFPTPHEFPWHAMHEKLKLSEVSLEVIRQGADRVESLFAKPDHFAHRVIARLINLCLVLELWADVPIQKDERYLNPEEMQRRAVSASVAVLRSLASNISAIMIESEESMHVILHGIVRQCMNNCSNILSLSDVVQYPLRVAMLLVPRIESEHVSNVVQHPQNDPFIKIDSCARVPSFLSIVCEICIGAISPPALAHWNLVDLARSVVSQSRQSVEFLLSPSCTVTASIKARALSRLGMALCSESLLQPEFSGFSESLLARFVTYRLQLGPNPEWNTLDIALQELFKEPAAFPTFHSDVQPALTILLNEAWGDADHGLRVLGQSYLRYVIPSLDKSSLQSVVAAIQMHEKMEHLTALLEDLHERLSFLSRVHDEGKNANEYTSRWQVSARAVVQALVEPDELAWMDDDESLSDGQYISRALCDIDTRYKRPLYNPSSPAREALATQLGSLPCIMAHAGVSQCIDAVDKPPIDTVSAFMSVGILLLEGPPGEVTPRVRRNVYDALSKIFRHHTSGFGGGKLEHIGDMVMRALKDNDRSVRLSAGRSLVELIRLYQRLGSAAWKRTEPLFGMIYRLFGVAEDRVKETTLITLGHIGRIATAEVLGQDICCLLAQLGYQNPIVKGTAHLQLQALAKHHKKTPYNLVSPYLDQVAPFLVSYLCTQPNLLAESCSFFAISPVDFISITLSRTLPQLYAGCDTKVLEAISKEMGEKTPQLFMRYCHHILAYVFRLQGPGQTNKVLNFIMTLLGQNAQRDIDLVSVVRSCIVPLLAELVVMLGEQDPDQAGSAKQGLQKVERLMTSSKPGIQTGTSGNTGSFLKSYMLGIISHLNDLLQGVYGKRSIETKKTIVRSLGQFVLEVGTAISGVAPQIMATLQTVLANPQLGDVALDSWYIFLTTLELRDLASQIGPSSASFVANWSTFSLHGREVAKRCLEFLVIDKGGELDQALDDIADLGSVPQLAIVQQSLLGMRKKWTLRDKLRRILERSASENITVAVQSLTELKSLMLAGDEISIRKFASGDVFDPSVGRILSTVLSAACRDGEGAEALRLLAFNCLGILGAVDPDRVDVDLGDTRMVMQSNFVNESESVSFALHLITHVLVGAFRSTSDIRYQSHLAFAIQELLRFCKFTPALVNVGSTTSIPLKVRSRWNSLPKHVLETITPLLDSKFSLDPRNSVHTEHPIYPVQNTYREWIQSWTSELLTKASGERAKAIFQVFSAVVRYKDVTVAHHLLPHLVLNILISGNEEDTKNIRLELISVLEDQISLGTQSSPDKRLLSAQTVFMLLDHLNQWIRVVRQDIGSKRSDSRKTRASQYDGDLEEQLLKVDSILSSINQDLMAKAAFQCKAYARSLMNFEGQVMDLRARNVKKQELEQYYERLHEIYAHLDEPDGMEGVSTLVLSPSLEHQIRQHESIGRWTSAQSCWEVRLQHSPDNPDFHLGLLRCLRNLGHYDTLRTHVEGVLTRNPDWKSLLIGFQVESEWMLGNWNQVQALVEKTTSEAAPILVAQVLMAMRIGDSVAVSEKLANARKTLGAPIIAAGPVGYRRSYEAVVNLHVLYELDIIHSTICQISRTSQAVSDPQQLFDSLSRRLSARLESTLPTFRTQEPILNMRRVAFGLSYPNNSWISQSIGQSWLVSAKIARKAGYWQTAYSAMLQVQQYKAPFAFIENAKLIKASGEPLRALQELENCMRVSGILDQAPGVIDLTNGPEDTPTMTAKAQVLRARWMNDSDRYDVGPILKVFTTGADLWPKWESGQFHLGQYHDQCFKSLTPEDKRNRGLRMNANTVRAYAKAIRYGSKYIYQTVPRLLTLWLDMGENEEACRVDIFSRVNNEVARAIKNIPAYKWYTAFPQIVSRIGHRNNGAYEVLSKLISMVIQEYPRQALWLFTSVVKSTTPQRGLRGKQILDQLRSQNQTNVPKLVNESLRMTEELLALCDYPIRKDVKMLTMRKDLPGLYRLAPSQLLIPLQESLTANLPPTSSDDASYHPFPVHAPTFTRFSDEVEIMRSLAQPRKITIQGSDGRMYMFLGKPKDDLRKDARLMEFNTIINKLLKANSESRRRQLHIRTYGVVTLNEECGFIQWVPNTIPLRPVLIKGYERRSIKYWTGEIQNAFEQIKKISNDKEVAQYFTKHILSGFPPVFHEWFIETFPEPTTWLASRLSYSRTAAVMSMVGFILGLGDRHCENILLDTVNGDIVHVDFNCLFEKGKSLETPERVPFRLTHNVVDGFGVTGVEGVFRIACEVTMQLLRDNKDTLMTVLDTFVHDPLVEWEDEKRKKDRERNNRSTVDLRTLAKNALNPIDKKLRGIYTTSRERPEKATSTSSLVEMLIQESTDLSNLARMYPGWASWQ